MEDFLYLNDTFEIFERDSAIVELDIIWHATVFLLRRFL
jgi:hypothetical protein